MALFEKAENIYETKKIYPKYYAIKIIFSSSETPESNEWPYPAAGDG